MTELHTQLLYDSINYTGKQLRALWAYEKHDILGDSAIAFIGPCNVRREFMRDMEDLKDGSRIESKEMLHFIIEHFDCDLEKLVLRQCLLMAAMAEKLNKHFNSADIVRKGSDLYDGEFKLTVSIASMSQVSGLIHAGINISSAGTPVPTRGLGDYGIDPRMFAQDMLKAYAAELADAHRARCKVRPCP
jgi:uncharacterized protein